jgi:hypothetical protein
MLDHVIGWLAKVWTSLALVPKKRLIIVFPFVATKNVPRVALKAQRWFANAVHQKIVVRRCCGRKRRNCLLQLARLSPSGCASSAQTTRPGYEAVASG